MHLRAIYGTAAVAIVLNESKHFGKPVDCGGYVLVSDMRQDDIRRDGTVLEHSTNVT
jgi:hypothetical protein